MALIVSEVDLHLLENAKAHRTIKYELVHQDPAVPVFRRGQDIAMTVKFKNRAYNPKNDKLRFLFFYVDSSKKSSPRGGAWLTENSEMLDDKSLWAIQKLSSEGKILKIKIKTPVDLPIGKWEMRIKTSLRSNLEVVEYKHPAEMFIILNPWHKDDEVYMPDTDLLEEYVMNDIGKVYVGSTKRPKGRHWIFGQFQAPALLAFDKIMNECDLAFFDKGDPIELARMLSEMINNTEGEGVLEGNWSGEYSGGTPPTMWTGSVPILEQYVENGTAVKYGQCWVYAAVTTAVCRAIGMPSRVVTNFVSAHDTDKSLSIDKFYNEDNEEYNRYKDSDEEDMIWDSVWNFHVWNDVWMARPDLPKGYGGWQAIDATPQEQSAGYYQCGPASLEAIKRGEVGFQYDVTFILAEVNADMIEWKDDENSILGIKKIKTDTKNVGQKLLTKRPFVFDPNGERDMDDVMHMYKDPEGSTDERLCMLKAAYKCDRACYAYDVNEAKELNEINFKLNDIETINIGNSFSVVFEMENTVDTKRTIDISATIMSVYYTGVKGKIIKKVFQTIEVPPKSKKQLKIDVTVDDYLDKLVEYSLLKSHAIATVKETKETWSGEDDFQITKPSLEVQANAETLKKGVENSIVFNFKNPLKKRLTNCYLAIDSPGLIKFTKQPVRDILPEEKINIVHTVTPESAGSFKVIAILYSKELQDIMGNLEVDVK